MGETSPNSNGIHQKIIIGVVTIATYYVLLQINITSRHLAVAFDIPIHNIGLYFDKLYSLRCFMIVTGYVLESAIYQLAGGDGNGKNEGERARKYVNIIFYSLLLIVRILFLVVLIRSPQLGFHIYLILTVEALVYGFQESGLLCLAAEYMSIVSLVFNMTRGFIFLFQLVLDAIWYKNPLLMIKIQVSICILLTFVSICLWSDYIFRLKPSAWSDNGQHTLSPFTHNHDYTMDAVVSPFVMLFLASTFKDFLTPGTLPYALLQRDKCHMINMCLPLFYVIPPLSIYGMENAGFLQKWESHYNWFFILLIPMATIFVYSFLAMHTLIPSARAIINSRPRIMVMTIALLCLHCFIETLDFMAIARYAVNRHPYGYTVQNIFNVFALLSRSFFGRISVGYTVTRISLGYHLPKFRPTHKMSNSNLAFYIIRQTHLRALKDLQGDFRFDIKKYL